MIAQPPRLETAVIELAAVTAERLVMPNPHQIYRELLAIHNDEQGSIQQVEDALNAQSQSGAPGDVNAISDRIEQIAIAAGADADTVRKLLAELEDAQIRILSTGQEASFIIGFACGLRRAKGGLS